MIYEKFEKERRDIESTIISRSKYFEKRMNEVEFSGKLSDVQTFKDKIKDDIHIEHKEYQKANQTILNGVDESFMTALFDEYGVAIEAVNCVVFKSLDKGSYYEKECDFIDKIELAESVMQAVWSSEK